MSNLLEQSKHKSLEKDLKVANTSFDCLKLSDFQTIDPKTLVSKKKEREEQKTSNNSKSKLRDTFDLSAVLNPFDGLQWNMVDEVDEEDSFYEPTPMKLFE